MAERSSSLRAAPGETAAVSGISTGFPGARRCFPDAEGASAAAAAPATAQAISAADSVSASGRRAGGRIVPS